jgi:hypothetical protein
MPAIHQLKNVIILCAAKLLSSVKKRCKTNGVHFNAAGQELSDFVIL